MIEYKHAVKSDLAEIETLLTYYDLPASDCFLHLENFAVSPEFKGHGIAKSLFQMVYDLALEQGKESLYLLTTTASDYFKKLGFSECVRSNCPEPITCTKQFSELCPGSAITMLLAL